MVRKKRNKVLSTQKQKTEEKQPCETEISCFIMCQKSSRTREERERVTQEWKPQTRFLQRLSLMVQRREAGRSQQQVSGHKRLWTSWHFALLVCQGFSLSKFFSEVWYVSTPCNRYIHLILQICTNKTFFKVSSFWIKKMREACWRKVGNCRVLRRNKNLPGEDNSSTLV